MGASTFANKPSVLETIDEFMAVVPWGGARMVLVHRRQHAGRVYVRLRTWNKHRTKRVYYPSKRSFVIPVQNASALADAIEQAACGVASPKPEWFLEREQEEAARLTDA